MKFAAPRLFSSLVVPQHDFVFSNVPRGTFVLFEYPYFRCIL
jgi:hypothetical protein